MCSGWGSGMFDKWSMWPGLTKESIQFPRFSIWLRKELTNSANLCGNQSFLPETKLRESGAGLGLPCCRWERWLTQGGSQCRKDQVCSGARSQAHPGSLYEPIARVIPAVTTSGASLVSCAEIFTLALIQFGWDFSLTLTYNTLLDTPSLLFDSPFKLTLSWLLFFPEVA